MRRFLLAALTVALAGCGEEQANGSGPATQPAREAVEVTLADVTVGALPETIDLVGTLYGDEEAVISSKLTGRVQEILADVGDRVEAAQALAQIDPTDYELVVRQREMALLQALASLGVDEVPPDDFDVSQVATVDRARYQAANARTRMERARQLYSQEPPLISEQEFTDLETAYQVSERNHDVAVLEARQQLAVAKARDSELDTARQSLADTVVRAPGAASASTQPAAHPRYAVTQRLVSTGEYVSEGKAMFRLVADDPIKYRAAVPERFAAQVATGQVVTLRVEGSEQPFTGTVSRINPAIDVETRTFTLEVLVPNAEQQLKPGAFARGVLEVGERENVVFVPRDAVVSFAGLDKVFSVADGKAVEHTITLLQTSGDMLPIREDLGGARRVVTLGSARLAKDVPVTVGDARAQAASDMTDTQP